MCLWNVSLNQVNRVVWMICVRRMWVSEGRGCQKGVCQNQARAYTALKVATLTARPPHATIELHFDSWLVTSLPMYSLSVALLRDITFRRLPHYPQFHLNISCCRPMCAIHLGYSLGVAYCTAAFRIHLYVGVDPFLFLLLSYIKLHFFTCIGSFQIHFCTFECWSNRTYYYSSSRGEKYCLVLQCLSKRERDKRVIKFKSDICTTVVSSYLH